MKNLLYSIHLFFKGRKIALFSLLFLFLFILLHFSLKLNFVEDITKLIPQSEETKTLNKVLNNVDFSDKIVVNIISEKNGTPDELSNFASELLDSLQVCCKDYIADIQGEFTDDNAIETMDFIYKNLPLFLSDEDYKYTKRKLSNDSISELVESNYKTLISPSGIIVKKNIRKDPFGLSYKALKKLEKLKITDNFDIYNGFLMTADKKNFLLFVKPKLPANETDANADFIKKLYQLSESLNDRYENKANVEYYGSTIIAVANANQIKTDIQYTVSIAMTVLLLILIFFYKKISIPLILFLPTVFGALVAITSLYFIRDEISAISLGIGSILLGITLDYSLHILTHFKDNQDVKKLYRNITMPILMSSITTAIAFLCLLLLKSQALQDLGVFASISVISASVFALFLIPLLYKPKPHKTVKKNIIEKLANYEYNKSKWFILGFSILFVASIFTYKSVRFNKDLSKMNYMNESSLEAEKNLESILNLSSKSVYIVTHGDDINSVLDNNSKIAEVLSKAKEKNTILQFSSVGSVVLSEEKQQEKIKQWNSFWKDSVKEQVKLSLIKNGEQIGFQATTYQPFFNLINSDFKPITLDTYSELKPLLTNEYLSNKSGFKTAVSIVKLKDSKKEELKGLIAKIPNTLLIDRKHINETFLGGLKDDFSKLINYSFLAVFLILFLFYRNIELTLLTSIPILLTWFVTLGIMGFLSIEFTIFNVIVSTFIFGLGVDYSIFMTNALVHDYTYGTKDVKTYKVSIILSVLTTILGVGVLIFAKHPALISISKVSLVGILTTLFVCFIIQPLLFNFFIKNRAKKGFKPIQIRSFFHSIFLMTFYSLAGMLLPLISLLLFPIIPVSKKTKFRWLHKAVSKLVTIVLYGNPFLKKKVINAVNEDFTKPAIIIANHSSSLDTLTMGLVTHNIVYLVNDWVYKSPVFGVLARVLGFYPVSNGVDDSVEHLREKVNQGYSLVVFPEGKRSLTNKVGRFHKGAFFLQKKLKIDILPIYFHGNAEVMPKNDFIIHNGSLTAKIGNRIAYNDSDFGETSRGRTKSISKFYKKELLKFREELETENYFKDILFSNYLYKDKAISKLIKQDFSTHKKTYHLLNAKISENAKILHVANDFGQIDILLISKFISRKITTYIQDATKLTVAKNTYSNNYRKVVYCDTIQNIDLNEFDTLLLSKLNSVNIINSIEIGKFDTIFLVNVPYHYKINGFEIAYENEHMILLKKI